MATRNDTIAEFNERIEAPSANYPWGAYKDKEGGVSGTGTPFIAEAMNNWDGFFQGILSEASLTPSGDADTAVDSQYRDAVKIITQYSLAGSGTYLTIDQNTRELIRGLIDLTSNVANTLPVANGGTGVTTLSDIDIGSLQYGVSFPATPGTAGQYLRLASPTQLEYATGTGTGLTYADVGGMVSGNVETGGISVTYDGVGEKLDFAINSMTDSRDTGTADKIMRFFNDTRVLLGYNAGTSSIGLGNTAVGNNALSSGDATTINNVAVGYNSGNSLSGLAAHNVAVGYNALPTAAATNYNIAIGTNTLNALAGGDGRNIAIGYQAASVEIGQTDGISIGYNAGGDTECVLIGNGSSTGTSGVSIGHEVSNGGNYNVVVGWKAKTTGTSNVVVGSGALQSTTGASENNVIIGYDSCQITNVVSGSVVVGYRSGSTTGGAHDISDSVLIGEDVGPSADIQHAYVLSNSYNNSESFIAILGDASVTKTVLRGNVLVGASSVPTGAANSISVASGTQPSAVEADSIAICSDDVSAGNTTLALFTEGSPVTTETPPTGDSTIVIKVNGTSYKLHATAI